MPYRALVKTRRLFEGRRALGVVVGACGVAFGLGTLIRYSFLQALDLRVTLDLQKEKLPGLEPVMVGFTNAGDPIVVPVLGLLSAAVLYRAGLPRAAKLVLGSTLSVPANVALKHLWDRKRPDTALVDVAVETAGTSFPSGHAMGATAFYGALAALAWIHVDPKRYRLPLVLVLVAIPVGTGVSRIYLGAHWLSDVVAGSALGLLILVPLVACTFGRSRRRSRRRPPFKNRHPPCRTFARPKPSHRVVPNDRIVLILNPASGSSDGDFRERIVRGLEAKGASYEVRETTEETDGAALARAAREEGVERVMACGGDGTVMAVVNGLGGNREGEAPVTLSIVPGGTANLVATALGIPDDVEKAIEIALEGREREVDLGRRDDTLFALGIGVGLTERLVSQTSAETKEKLGRWAYLIAMLKELGVRPHRFEICLDGGKTVASRGVAVVIANTGEIGHGLSFAPDARLDDGLLDVCVLHRFGAGDLLRLGFRALAGRLREDRATSFYQARRVELRADPPLEVQIDGESVTAKTPIVAEALRGALRVRVPQEG